MSRLDEKVRERIAEDYAAGMTIYEIACKYKVCPSTVCRTAHSKGLKTRGRGCPKGIKQNVVYSKC